MTDAAFFAQHPFIAAVLAFALAVAIATLMVMVAAMFFWSKDIDEFKRVMHIMDGMKGAKDPTDEAGA
jgi:hypothetical protein